MFPTVSLFYFFKFIFIVSTERGIGEEFIMGPFLLNSVFRLVNILVISLIVDLNYKI